MQKIILINPQPDSTKGINKATIAPPLGLAYLAAVLEKHNHQVQIIDAHILDIEAEKITNSFSFNPDLVGISTNIITYRGGVECAKHIRYLYPDVPIIFGGPYSSSLAKNILEKVKAVNAVVVGEGENTLLDIVGSLHKKNIFVDIKGVIYRQQNQIIHNEPRPLIANLDDLPFPAYHLLPDLKKYRTRSRARPVGYLITSRGCPHQCTFCDRSIFGTVWRPHSVERIIEEIDYLVRHYGIRQLDILDDNFTFDMKRAGEILDCLSRAKFKLRINLQNGVRVDRVNEELLLKMQKAGVFKIGFGIESANQNIQKRAKKIIDLKKASALVKIVRSLGIVTYGFFMIGLPGESVESIEETIEFSLKMNPHFANFTICIPFPGTEIYEEAKKNGTLLEDVDNGIDAGFFGSKIFFEPDSIKPREIISYFKNAYKRFYVRPKKLLDILFSIRSADEFKWLMEVVKDVIELARSE